MTESTRIGSTNLRDAPYARLDFHRERRKGVPEVILCSSKTTEQSLTIAASFLARNGRAIMSRVDAELHAALVARYAADRMEWYPASRTAILRDPTAAEADDGDTPVGGRVGVITAGTSDQPIAEEAAIICREMGCEVRTVYDVGVAGLHRLFEPLRQMLDGDDVDVIIVAAGMDGALPSVVSGLVDVPVVGLPTSVGYGMGGAGHAALLAMLQTCSPGLAVVNIDNGVGAGAMAALIARRAELARRGIKHSALVPAASDEAL